MLFSLQSEHNGEWSDSATALLKRAMATVSFILKAPILTITCKTLPALARISRTSPPLLLSLAHSASSTLTTFVVP